MCDPYECQIAKEHVEKCMHTVLYDRNISFRIIKLYSVYFMKLGPIIMELIYKLCFGKTFLCELLSEILFKTTTLAQVFMGNEHLLWKELRQEMFIRILLVAKYSTNGKICAATLFLHNVRSLYDHLIEDHCEKRYGFFRLIEQILHCPPVVVYLVENGFLIKTLIIFSNSLKSMDIKSGVDLVQMFLKAKASRQDLFQVLEKTALLCSCLQISLKNIQASALFISKCTEAGKYLVQFCADFDDMQPCKKMSIEVSNLEDSDFLFIFYGRFILILSQLVKWIVLFDECAATTLKTFLEKFACNIKNTSDGIPCEFIYQKMVTSCNVETDKFSLFNLSHRVFLDILMGCCVKGTLSTELTALVFDDDKMLMWVSRPAITAMSSVMNNILPSMSERGNNMSHHIFVYQKSYLRYFFSTDLRAIQMLILHLDPELFFKYIWFNIVPSLQKRVDILKPLSLILRSRDPDICLDLRRGFILIYNALIECYFGSFSQNRDYHLLARQIIHSLASGHETVIDIQKHMCICHNMFEGTSTFIYMKNFLEKVIEKVSFRRNLPNTDKLSLKPEYLNSVNMFHLMYSRSDVYFVPLMFTYWRF
ncbi:hypothetical protein RF11_03426 [Thelohanellus kitauei]|uniref:Uncharacterized protein n=1 Tax=Thelohanellus kitauei TaxID=669202 RepID=A0A0C2MSM1_THEKT|nr:hypothetical protein RF11_03426 [Thelohanellus kitauei]